MGATRDHVILPGMRTMDSPALESAAGMAAAVRERRVAAGELVERALERIERLDPPVNSCVRVLADAARAEARGVDSSPGLPGELRGVPVTVKEIFDMRGERTTWGCPGLRDAPPAQRDDPHVARLREAGAIVVARTNVPELSCWGHTDNPVYGETRNPRDLTRTAGGSSGGAAASVALGIAPLGLGSDAGGSVRVPASFCGVVGLKPSFETLPADAAAQVNRLNCAGVLAGSVSDAALALRVLASERGPATEAPPLGPRGARIGATVDHGFAPVEPEVRDAFAAALERLAAGGVEARPADPPPSSPLPFIVPVLECEVYEAFADVLEGGDHGLSDATLAVVNVAQGVSGRDYVRALGERLAFEARWREFFRSWDVLLSPTTLVTAFGLGRTAPEHVDGQRIDPVADGDWYPTCFIANVLGAPAISIPCGVDGEGLPVGLQVMGRPGEDALVLAVAAIAERHLIHQKPASL